MEGNTKQNETAPKQLKVGDKVKITGGKYKKHGEGVLKVLRATYCDVEVNALGNEGLDNHTIVKVKIDYLFPINEVVVEMPEADELKPVDIAPDDYIVNNEDEFPLYDLEKQELMKKDLDEALWGGAPKKMGKKLDPRDYDENGEKYTFVDVREQEIHDLQKKVQDLSDAQGNLPTQQGHNLEDALINHLMDPTYSGKKVDIHMEDLAPEAQDILQSVEELNELWMKRVQGIKEDLSVALAERDQADDAYTKLKTRTDYLEELCRKILL